MEVKKLKWDKPILVELGNARLISFGQLGTATSTCNVGSAATNCVGGNLPLE